MSGDDGDDSTGTYLLEDTAITQVNSIEELAKHAMEQLAEHDAEASSPRNGDDGADADE